MCHGESKEGTMIVTPRQRWVSALLSILIALSVVFHLGQAVPAHADMGRLAAVMSSQSESPCDSGQHFKAAHCSVITACSLYAPLEASPEMFIADRAHSLPSADAVRVCWSATPQLQPPQYSHPI